LQHLVASAQLSIRQPGLQETLQWMLAEAQA